MVRDSLNLNSYYTPTPSQISSEDYTTQIPLVLYRFSQIVHPPTDVFRSRVSSSDPSDIFKSLTTGDL